MLPVALVLSKTLLKKIAVAIIIVAAETVLAETTKSKER